MFRSTIATIVLAAATLAGSAAASTGPGGLSGGSGCSIQCITTALVHPTASSASVQVTTSVPASVTVAVAKQAGAGAVGSFAGPGTAGHVSAPAFSTQRTIVVPGLQPETVYRIVVTARDAQGRTSTRIGTFQTLKAQVAVEPGPATFDTGLGCSAGCIRTALLEQSRAEPRTAVADIGTALPARLELVVSRGGTIVDTRTSQQLRTSWSPTVAGLLPATTYDVLVRATDAGGKVDERSGSFRTVDAVARVTIARIQVLDDSEKGPNRGEIAFDYWVNGAHRDGGGRRKLGTGDVVGAPVAGTSRTGAVFAVAAGADLVLDLRVEGSECDAVIRKNCKLEQAVGWQGPGNPPWATGGSNAKKMQKAWAVGAFRLADLLAGGALPPWYGTGVQAPTGHDGYMTFQTTSYRLKFRVLAYVDLEHRF